MNLVTGVILSLAYILGLLCTVFPWGQNGFLVLAVGTTIALPYFWRTSPWPRLLPMIGIVGLLAALYFQARLPQPASNDISKYAPTKDLKESTAHEQVVTVEGRVATMPRLTRSQRSQFWLEATQLSDVKGRTDKPADISKAVKGRLYVTVPLLQATGVYPGEAIAITGSLYKLKPAHLPAGFDFRAYLTREGIFAGLSGLQINFPDEPTLPRWRGHTLRQRIIRSQVRRLGSPEGMLFSSLALGSRTVDLPYELKDQFVQVGLAHGISVFGFKTCLILGLVLSLTQRLSTRLKMGLGTAALVIYVALTGLHPLALRAALMGFVALIALLTTRRQQKPWQWLLVATTLMLVFNPLWIWDLEFQLSFLATLGFVISVQPITKRLDWLPQAFASLIAIPIAISLWTLPLQLYATCTSSHSILVNMITDIPLSVISIAGIISAIAALISPLAGSAIAGVLYHPLHWLILVVQFFSHLADNSVASSTMSILQFVALYGLLSLVWFQPWWQWRWWLTGLVAISLVILPIWPGMNNLFRITVLSIDGEPALVIQDQGKVTLINSGNSDVVSATVMAFLKQQRINQIDWAVALDSQNSSKVGWLQILARLPVKNLYVSAVSSLNLPDRSQEEDISKRNIPSSETSGFSAKDDSISAHALRAAQLHQVAQQSLQVGQTLSIGSITIKLINSELPVLQLQIRNQTWLLFRNFKLVADNSLSSQPLKVDKTLSIKQLSHASVLCWSGELSADLLKVVQPTVAIASSPSLETETMSMLSKSNVKLYWTRPDGAIQWTPRGQFETALEATEDDGSLL